MVWSIRPLGLAFAATTLIGLTPTETYSHRAGAARSDASNRTCAAARPAAVDASALDTAAVVVGAESPRFRSMTALARSISRSPRRTRWPALFRPGLELRLRLQPCRGDRLSARRSGSIRIARCASGARRWRTDRTSTRRWTRTPTRARSAAKYANWLAAQGDAGRASARRRDDEALFGRPKPRIARRSTRPMPTPCSPQPRRTRQRRYRPPRRRSGDGHQSRGYWTADEAAQAAARRSGQAGRDGRDAQTGPSAGRAPLHPPDGNGPDPEAGRDRRRQAATPLAPTAGHLVHMPAHIYYRLGRWKDSMRVNVERRARRRGTGSRRPATRAWFATLIIRTTSISSSPRRRWRATCRPRSVRRRKLARLLDPDDQLADRLDPGGSTRRPISRRRSSRLRRNPGDGPPDARLPYPRRCGILRARWPMPQLRNRAGFDREMACSSGCEIRRLQVDDRPGRPSARPAAALPNRSRAVAGRSRRYAEAAQLYREAVAIEDKIPYMEPPFWYYPVHQSLGAALYRAGKYEDARDAFITALAQSPNNGWALYGLAPSERALGRPVRGGAGGAGGRPRAAGRRRLVGAGPAFGRAARGGALPRAGPPRVPPLAAVEDAVVADVLGQQYCFFASGSLVAMSSAALVWPMPEMSSRSPSIASSAVSRIAAGSTSRPRCSARPWAAGAAGTRRRPSAGRIRPSCRRPSDIRRRTRGWRRRLPRRRRRDA